MRSLLLLVVLSMVTGCRDSAPAPSAPADPRNVSEPTPSSPGLHVNSDSLTVVFFGDSLTEGYGLANPRAEAYPALIADRIAEAGIPARVINAGNSGETTAGGLRRVDWILGRTRPDVFVLALGGNDMLRGFPVTETESNLSAILEKVREAAPDARLVLAGMEALANLGEDYRQSFRAVYPEVAERFDATLIPFLLDGVGGVARLNQPDGVHPTAEGQQVVADTVWETLGPLVGATG